MSTAEQNPATNPVLATPPDAPANSAEATGRSISAFPRRRSYKRWILLASFVVLVLAAAFLWQYPSGFESTDDALVDVHLYPVIARISGYIRKVQVQDNEWVNEGSTLVEIDPKDYEVALAKAQATLEASEAAAKSSNIDVPISSVDTLSQLKSTSSDIKNAEAAIEAAEADGAAAQQAIQEAHSRLTQAQAHYEDAQAGPQRVASTRAKALSAMADVQRKRAAVEQAQLNLGYTRILAPIAGEVTKKVVGLNVDAGEQLLTVVPLDQVWITANFEETQLKRMRVGQKAEIALDSNGRTYHGLLDSIAGAMGPTFSLLPPENATGKLHENRSTRSCKDRSRSRRTRNRQLRPGTNVEAKVYLHALGSKIAHSELGPGTPKTRRLRGFTHPYINKAAPCPIWTSSGSWACSAPSCSFSRFF